MRTTCSSGVQDGDCEAKAKIDYKKEDILIARWSHMCTFFEEAFTAGRSHYVGETE